MIPLVAASLAPSLVERLIEYALKYGPSAALAIIKIMQKENPTFADWEAAFAVAETPYGLTPKVIVTPPNP